MKYIKSFKPDGSVIEVQDDYRVAMDTSRIVTHPVRRYFHREHTQYTILACADIGTPYNIFYDLEVSRPNDIEFPTSSYKDIRVFKQLIAEFPIPEQAYINAENKLRKKIDKKRLQIFQERRNKLMERIRLDIMTGKQTDMLENKANEYVELVAKANAPRIADTVENQAIAANIREAENEVQTSVTLKNAIANDDGEDDDYNDDDDYSGGVLGVYARGD